MMFSHFTYGIGNPVMSLFRRLWEDWNMAKRKGQAPAVRTHSATPVTVETVLTDGLQANPEIQIVREIAMRAREMEAREPPLELDMTTETVATPINSQGLWQNPV
jgi:hypothetical protein